MMYYGHIGWPVLVNPTLSLFIWAFGNETLRSILPTTFTFLSFLFSSFSPPSPNRPIFFFFFLSSPQSPPPPGNSASCSYPFFFSQSPTLFSSFVFFSFTYGCKIIGLSFGKHPIL
ncbi:unnamed protein product [Cuscuta europaea]|uniref:Uncharacterized protein n=1 Tax=Cuscuta europaea TaxID=41803 RepID=A0A9P1EE52_CUSEU|nr:unnamed protein product [Cuscuta europaea]